MRILCIRGENLASLYGKFEVSLDRAPIADAGIFCISGPTGAGKSTVLDALCLALYGRTPRTRERGGVLVGREDQAETDRVAANDPRALLSRGTGDGHAEVEFEGEGGVVRARWSVRRARGQAGGRLQAATMTLHEVATGRSIGEGLAGVQDEIAKRVGYSFEEFCRAVLLPQFEFTNFLRARPDERAAILERVTGKELYTALSIRAHERAAEFNRRLGELADRLEGTEVLDEAERAELEAEIDRREGEVERIGKELEEARKAAEWYRRESVLVVELSEADEDLRAAWERNDAADFRRAELAGVEAAQPLRSVRDGAVTAEHRAASARLEAGRLAERAKEAEERAGEARSALALAEAGASRARAEWEAAGPELDRAKELDRRIGAEHETVAKLDAELGRAIAAVETTHKEIRVHQEAAGKGRAEKENCEEWLNAHRDRWPLADGWTRWEAELARHGEAVADLASADTELGEARHVYDDAATAHEAAVAAQRMHEELAGAAERASEDADTAAAGIDRGGLASRREFLAARMAAFEELSRLAERAAAATAERHTASIQVEEAAALASTATDELERLAGERSTAEGRLSEARESYELIRRSLSFDDARSTLVEGQPCPLCGSLQHPWARGAPVGLLEEQKSRVTQLEDDYKGLGERQTQVERDRVVARERGERALVDAARAKRELSSAHVAFERLARDHGIAIPPEDAGAALARLGTDANTELTTLKKQELKAERLLAEASRLRRAADNERKRLEVARAVCGSTERALLDATHRAKLLEGERNRFIGDRDAAEEGLAAVLRFHPAWREEARGNPAAFLASCRSLVSTIGDRRDRLTAAERDIASADVALGIQRARLVEREGIRATAMLARDEAIVLRDRLIAERRTVLGGKATPDVERAHREAIQRADDQRDSIRVAHDAAVQAAAVAASDRDGAIERARGLDVDVAAAAAGLAESLASVGLDRASLDQRLLRDHGWIASRRKEFEGLVEAVRSATTLRDERARKLDEHVREGRPSLGSDAAIALRERGATELAAAERARDTVRFRRQSDDEAHGRIAGLHVEHKALERTAAPWLTLASLIGSSDGKKFRMFVQGLAFDLLLASANEHLKELSHRYRLARVPGTDLDLQVIDQDLGDEVRTINGLSGGETFLVSLALALGLATLSTKANHAKTLFIDEGFGTLDRDTLDHAMVALEGLQSTGRTVGVISHVPELHERVGVRVEVERVAVGRSRVTVRGPG